MDCEMDTTISKTWLLGTCCSLISILHATVVGMPYNVGLLCGLPIGEDEVVFLDLRYVGYTVYTRTK